MELFATDGAMLLFKAILLCVVFLLFFGIGWILSKALDWFINFWSSDE